MPLYKFYWDCGRMGNLDGLFVATPDIVESIIGQSVYFGEVLGKHSEVYGTINKDDIVLISDDEEKVAWLIDVVGDTTISGFNPLEYVAED